MAKGSGSTASGTVIGILAIVAGVLLLLNILSLHLIVGVYLIIFGILALIGK
jgi:uncharacterized membrane protein HdeD (DUF308 family)